MSQIRAFFSFSFFFCLFLMLVATPVWGQTTTSLRGTVLDQSGGIVTGAKVTLTNTGTNVVRTTSSAGDGAYVFDPLQVGTYMVGVEKNGFAKFVQSGITLELNQNGRLDVTLKVGQGSETVEVKANVAQVDTTGAVLGKVENQRMIQDLPLVERDTLQLGLLQAGVFAPDPDDGSGNLFSVSGQRSESLTFLLDGADNTSFLGNNIVVSPNPDAVQEFKILTNNYDAQYGRTSGGIINQITKSGTNSYHGDLFEFLRNNDLNARNYFLPFSSAPPFHRNEFGGTIGGPILKDKLFFFLAYQGARRREAQVSPILTVPSAAERTGNFGELCGSYDGAGNCTDPSGTQLVNPLTGNNIPNNNLAAAGLVNPTIQNYITRGYLPTANLPNNGFISDPVGTINDDQGVVHIDYNHDAHNTFSLVYVIDDERETLPFQIVKGASTGGDVPFGSGFSNPIRTQVATASWIHTFSPNLVNEFRFSVNRDAEIDAIPQDKTSPADLGFANVSPDDVKGTAPPIILTPDFNLGPSPGGPTHLALMTFRWGDGLTWTHGHHEFKFGGDISRVRNDFNFDFFNNGSFDFGSFGTFTGDVLADFIGGFWDNYFQFSNAVYGIRQLGYSGYAQDTWKVNPRFTVNLGIRYEYNSPQSDTHNNILGFFPNTQSTVFPDAPADILYPGDPGTPNKALVYPDRNNFAPRFGFAWDMFGNAKLVMRGGFGIFYDIEDGALNLQFGGQPPFGAVSNFFPSGYTGIAGDFVSDPFGPFGFENPFPFASAGKVGTFQDPKLPFAYTTFPHFRTPYSENFNYGFQWQATRDTMVEAVYVGSLGRKLISSGETNPPDPAIMQQQLDQFGFINSDCARRVIGTGQDIAQCTGGVSPIDPNGAAGGATQLLTNFGNGLSDSDQLQVTVDKRFSHHVGMRVAYTLAKTIDLTSGFRSRSAEYTDPFNPRLDRGLADFDTPQRLVISGIFELPFDRGVHSEGVLKKVLAGWQANVIATFQKGNPFTLYQNNNSSGQNNFLDRPDIIGPVQYFNPRHRQAFQASNPDPSVPVANCLGNNVDAGTFWFNPNSFDCVNVQQFTFGTLGRNTLRGPGINNWDISINKTTKILESKSIEFRAEFFNAFNHTQFSNPDNQGFSGTFGQVTQTRVDARIIQFGLKFYY